MSQPENSMREVDHKFDCVAIFYNGYYRQFFARLARSLKERHGSDVHLYCARLEIAEGQARDTPLGTYDGIHFITPSHPTAFPTDLDEASVVRTARAFETRYGRSMNWFAMLDRHMGRGYATAGYHHPRSRQSENSNYIQFLDSYNKYFKYWEDEFERRGTTLLINGNWRESLVAKAHGVPIRTATSARFQNLHYWTTDEYGDSDAMTPAYGREPLPSEPVALDSTPVFQESLRKTMNERGRVPVLARRIARKLVIASRHRLQGHSKAKLYYLRDEIALFVRQLRETRRLTQPNMTRLDDLKGQPFVYFPLQVDPETNFQGRSPEYHYQHAAAVSVSRDLPAGVRLAIKEHLPAIGRRPDRFYDQLRDLKNVVLLDIRESGLDAVKRARAVVTINGSAGQEAGVLGKPVITFGRHNLYNCLPHVHVITDEAQISPALASAICADFDSETAAREGARFLTALKSFCFDMESFGEKSRDAFSEAAIEAAYERLVESLAETTGVLPAGTIG